MNPYEMTLDDVLTRIENVRTRVNQHQIIKLVAVSKSVDTDAVELMYQNGQRAFGENRVQEFKRKSDILTELPLEWHFIGRMQTNKINQLIDLRPALMHSCDGLDMAQEINKRLAVKERKMNVLLQINSAKEDVKAGVEANQAIDIYQQIKESCPNINLKGVMSIGAHSEDEALIRESFEKTFAIYESLEKDGASICSMGMSNDFELAVECGANMLRLGSVLFK